MPFAGYDDFDACVRDNADKDDPEAYCAAIKRKVESANSMSDHTEDLAELAYSDDSNCPNGQVKISGNCVPVDMVDAPPSIVQSDYDSTEVYQTASKHNVKPECALSILEDGEIQADDPCQDGWTMVGTKQQNGQTVPNCVPEEDAPNAEGFENSHANDRVLAEFEEGEAVMWDWQGETVHGRVSEVREEQATVNDDVTISGDDDEPVYIIDEYDDASGGFRRDNVAKPESSLDESTRDLPDRTDENMLAKARVMQTRRLNVGPIEREANGNTVRYNNVALLGTGVWTDQASKTATLYDEQTLENIEPEFDKSEHDGPPVNIMHDLSNSGEPNEASIGGHIDPNSLQRENNKLYGDLVLDTTTPAGDFADENLQSALESRGNVGFGGPSVELDVPREHLEVADDHPKAQEHVEKAELTGTGLVMDPASDNVSFDVETAARGVAMAAGGNSSKTTHVLTQDMSSKTLMDADEIRETLDMFGFDGLDEMTDDEVMDMAEDLHDDLMSNLNPDMENEEHGDMEDDEEDENMGDYNMMDMDEMMTQMEDLRERLAEVESQMGEMAAMSDVKSELSKLADSDTVEELDKRLSNLEDTPVGGKTLSDTETSTEGIDWSNVDDGISSKSDGSFSR